MSDAVRETLDRHTAVLNAGDAVCLCVGVAVHSAPESTVGAHRRAAHAETVKMLTQRDGKIARYLVESAAAALGTGLGKLAAA